MHTFLTMHLQMLEAQTQSRFDQMYITSFTYKNPQCFYMLHLMNISLNVPKSIRHLSGLNSLHILITGIMIINL